jgi:ribose transport system permease protein
VSVDLATSPDRRPAVDGSVMADGSTATVESKSLRPILFFREFGIALFWLALLATFASTADRFASWTNFTGILTASTVVALLALGQSIVILAGSIDLSIAPTAALTGVVCAQAIESGAPAALGVTAGLAAAALCGLVNGLLVDIAGLSPLIATLATLTAIAGVALLVTDGKPVFGIDELTGLGQGRTFGLQNPILIVAGIYLAAWVIMSQTRFGIRMLAFGGNAEAARRTGVRAHVYTIVPFVACSTVVGLAGLLILARLGTAQPVLGEALVFDAVTAVALAGVVLTGGRGNVLKVWIGAIVVATIANGLVLLKVSSYWTYITTGTLLALAVWSESALSAAIGRAGHDSSDVTSTQTAIADA